MDEAVKVKGVFLHSMNLNSEFMVKCLQVLVNIFPEIRITSIVSDELHCGLRVYFSFPDADLVLSRKHLIVSGGAVRIGPLRTLLTIHGFRKNGDDQLKAELCEGICNQFGELIGDLDPVSNSGTWLQIDLRACVDVPELEELEIFNHEGYPDMFICLPNKKERLIVTFHCRRCKNDGHVYQNCPSEMLHDETLMTDYSEVLNLSNSHLPFTLQSENRETSANEEFSSAASNSQGVFSSLSYMNADPLSINLSTPLRPPSIFFAPPSTTAVGKTNTPPASTAAVGSTKATPTPTITAEATNTAPTPTTTAEAMNTSPTLTTAVEDTKILSLRLQQIINMACEEINVIKRDQLDAFFFYVKNRSNLLQIAKVYTNNVGGLIKLLQRIILLFYTVPSARETKDEQFIKWLKGLVERFEGTILWRDSEEMLRS